MSITVQRAIRECYWVGCTLALVACSKPAGTNAEAHEAFAIPKLAQAMDFLPDDSLIHSDQLDAAMVEYWGKFRFASSIDLKADLVTLPREDYIEAGPWRGSRDSIGTDGLQLALDYSTAILLKDPHLINTGPKYPVYLFNETTKSKVLWGKDGHVFAIQEAIDSSGQWSPIEGRPYDFCGNGRWGEVIRPGQFAVFGMTKYAGDYDTKIRVRLVNGDATYVSQPIHGKINYAQFRLKPDTYFFKFMREKPLEAIIVDFYGAWPLDYEPSGTE